MSDALLSAVREVVADFTEVPDDPDAPLGASSLTLVEIAEALEARFDLVVRASEVTPDTFGSLRALAVYVARKRGEGA